MPESLRMTARSFVLLVSLLYAGNAFVPVAVAQTPGEDVGTAVVSENRVDLIYASQRSSLAEGHGVVFGGVIETGDEGVNVDNMLDGSTLSVGPRSRVEIDTYVYSEGGTQSTVIELTVGVLRFSSGRTASENISIVTPVAQLAPRGTVFVVAHDPGSGSSVVVEDGVVNFANLAGNDVLVPAGSASTIATANTPPTDPQPPSGVALAAVANLNTALAVVAQSALGNAATYSRLSGEAGLSRTAGAQVSPTSGPANFGGDGRY